ncbi:BamA/TamA family outer membrane protein [Aliterella atlantica]|uniref:BamA/TamA family outer membrane protein n=1 Tax=Aliterella atlantica TaxID=1827278 RepID=UPI0009E56BCE|nr:BamA/TamA family outer membrane protein [Aliterella atlantica]
MPNSHQRVQYLRPIHNALWLVLALVAPLSLVPATASEQPQSAQKTQYRTPVNALSNLSGNLPNPRVKAEKTSNNVVVDTLPAPLSIAQQTPRSTTPNQSTTDTNPPADVPTPITPAPGTEGIPQQETPNQLEFDVTPDSQTPNIDNNAQPAAPAPTTPAPTTPATPAPEGTQPEADSETSPEVLVGEVFVRSQEGELSQELENEVYGAIKTRPGSTATREQLQEDINAVFATGFFANVRAEPEDTPLGVRVTFLVQPNPILRAVRVQANPGTDIPSVLPEKVVNDIFKSQYGSILNLRRFQESIKQLNKWYQDNGYVLAQVTEAPQVSPDGTVTLTVPEGVVENIQVSFRNSEGEATDDEGRPIKGRTREFIITRELELKPGQIFNRNTVQRDLQRVYGLGLFEDVNVSLNPGQDPRKVVVVVNVDERNSGSIGAGAGISSASGLFGSLSYQEQNLGGNNQDLGAEFQIGQRELLFDLRFTDPWIGGDPYRTSYTVNAFRRRSISLIFDGGENDIELPNGDRPRVLRLGGGVNFTRPLSKDPLRKSEWTASAGLEYQRVSIRDSDGEISPQDELGNDLSFSGDGTDDLLTLQVGAVRDRRNDAVRPTSGSLVRFGVEQSVPIGSGNILLNRVRGSYSQYLPVNFTNFNDGPETLAFNIQAGTVLGDLPPYEAFLLGGSNSVRGYDEGDLGSGRSFLQATAEYRFPVFSIVGGALFFDVGTDLGTGDNVPGNPAGVRGKSGSGFGYGVGVRVQSPLGPIRIDYGFTDEGDSRLHFGIGERF